MGCLEVKSVYLVMLCLGTAVIAWGFVGLRMRIVVKDGEF
jgi:hypothetical protein